ncbi:MAG: hypothetical protein GDA36_07380 [Rhodobacteraceae bacterium]|nr:hypothetical protein [Paracoccaceae bacterium]
MVFVAGLIRRLVQKYPCVTLAHQFGMGCCTIGRSNARRNYLGSGNHVRERGGTSGANALVLADDAVKITAIDISYATISLARGGVLHHGAQNVRFIQANLYEILPQIREANAIPAIRTWHPRFALPMMR